MKDYLISHIKDVDGITPVILMKLFGREFDYKLLDVYEVESFMDEFLSKDLRWYEHIYITDLTVPEAIYEKIENHSARDKFLIFDHHKTHNYASHYSYVTLDINECGTTLFYNYLKMNGLIETKSLNQYIRSVKNLDLWLFEQENDNLAPILDKLFSLYGIDNYIKEIVLRLQNNPKDFVLTPFEKTWLELEKNHQLDYINKCDEKMIRVRLNNIPAGVVFAEKYRNEIGHELLNRHPDLEFIVVINMNGGISFRSREVDVSKIASLFGGGGHKLASGSGITLDKKIQTLKYLFKGEITFED